MEADLRSSLRLEQMAPVVAIALALGAAFNAIDALPVGVFYDDALYTILGKSIASGDGYRYLNIPGQPLATHYPPGYPLLLAALWRISPEFPGNVALFKGVNALLVGVVAFLTYRFARERMRSSAVVAFGAALVASAAIPTLVLSSAVMSEIVFLALLLPWLLAAERGVQQPDARRAVLLAALGGLLFYVRAHAIVLIPALGASYLLTRNRRDGLVAVVVGVAIVLPWFVWVAAHDAAMPEPLRGAYGSYGAWLARGVRENGMGILVASLRDNLATTAAIIARSFAVSQREPFRTIAVLAVLPLAVAGIVSFYETARVTLLFLLLYLVTVLIWPFSPLRFIWGVWPLLVLLLLSGATFMTRSRSSRPGERAIRWLGLTSTAIACAGLLVFNVRGYANAWWTTVSRAMTPRIQPQLEWVVSRTDARAIVAADDEGAVYLYTGRQAVPANVFTAAQYFGRRPVSQDAANLRAIVTRLGPDYVVAWADPTIAAAELLTRERPPALVPFDTIHGGRVYRVPR